MKLKTGNPRVRGPRSHDRRPKARQPAEPSTFAWIEPLADVDPVIVDREVVVETQVEKQIFVDRPYEVTKEVVVEKEVFVDRPVPVTQKVFVDREIVVEKEVLVDRPVFVDREVIVEKPIEVTKEVVVEKAAKADKKPIVVEKQIFIDRPVEVSAAAVVADKAVKNSKKKRSEPKAIIIGRGPSLAMRIARIAPKPAPVMAGATALLIALVGVALISPSGDNATASRSTAAFAGTSSSSGQASQAKAANVREAQSTKKPLGKTRDPFAASGYVAPKAKSKTPAQTKTEAAANAKVVAGAPAAAAQSLYKANLTFYSSFTPWTKTSKKSGGWIDLGGKPTVKVISVGKKSIELFVVTDVEVITKSSKNYKYDDPIRQVHLDTDGVVRFSDYRDIQGDDVEYTIRYNGSDLIKTASKSSKK